MSYGAVGDGVTDDTKAIQAALTACADGGLAILPAPHVFLSFALTVEKPSNFMLAVAGTLRFSNDTGKWPTTDTHCLSVMGGDSVALTGGGLGGRSLRGRGGGGTG